LGGAFLTYFWSPFLGLKSRLFLTPKAVPNQRENYQIRHVDVWHEHEMACAIALKKVQKK
jgi:hypothetical protein